MQRNPRLPSGMRVLILAVAATLAFASPPPTIAANTTNGTLVGNVSSVRSFCLHVYDLQHNFLPLKQINIDNTRYGVILPMDKFQASEATCTNGCLFHMRSHRSRICVSCPLVLSNAGILAAFAMRPGEGLSAFSPSQLLQSGDTVKTAYSSIFGQHRVAWQPRTAP